MNTNCQKRLRLLELIVRLGNGSRKAAGAARWFTEIIQLGLRPESTSHGPTHLASINRGCLGKAPRTSGLRPYRRYVCAPLNAVAGRAAHHLGHIGPAATGRALRHSQEGHFRR